MCNSRLFYWQSKKYTTLGYIGRHFRRQVDFINPVYILCYADNYLGKVINSYPHKFRVMAPKIISDGDREAEQNRISSYTGSYIQFNCLYNSPRNIELTYEWQDFLKSDVILGHGQKMSYRVPENCGRSDKFSALLITEHYCHMQCVIHFHTFNITLKSLPLMILISYIEIEAVSKSQQSCKSETIYHKSCRLDASEG